ncbi:hypothetical protein BLOT_004839 [Blomia tropicalis]|nr:hypothetical protein BLOT_004839 [Blomia tropicalis]
MLDNGNGSMVSIDCLLCLRGRKVQKSQLRNETKLQVLSWFGKLQLNLAMKTTFQFMVPSEKTFTYQGRIGSVNP